MMPSAQPITMLTPPQSKPKIGFSIDSIVGNRTKNSSISEDSQYHDDSNDDGSHENLHKLSTSPCDLRRDYSHLIKRSRENFSPSPTPNSESDIKHSSRLSETNSNSDQDVQNNNNTVPHKQPITQKGPIMVPGIPASFINRSQIISTPQGPPVYPDIPQPGHPHFLQFQAAAALVHAQASQTGFSGTLPQHLPPLHNHPSIARDSYPLYPWLLSRHGRIFPHRFPGNFLLQPFRKPKRVRTAFSPSQLLKLEHAFEGNHYVVGSERKALAQQLSLTETQVKVWFQNRRTKHKRTQQDESDSKSGNKSTGSPKNFDSEEEMMDDDENEIDIEDESEETDNMA